MGEEAKDVPAGNRGSGQTVIMFAGFAMLLCISFAAVWLVQRTQRETDASDRAVRVENAITQAGSYLRRAESSQRGYLLSENASYLSFFESGIEKSQLGIDALPASDLESDEDRRDVARIRELAGEKIAELRKTVELQKSGKREEALVLVKTNVGENLMREVALLVEAMRDRLRVRSAQRREEGRTASNALLLVTLTSSLAIFVLALISTRLQRRNLAVIESARQSLASLNADLETRVAERTSDLQEANNEIQSFAYIVSHDLRSPLVNIMGFTSELEALRKDVFARLDAVAGPVDPARQQLSADFDEAFGFVKASTSKMDRLINAILKLARTGRRKLTPSKVDVTALAKTIATTMAHQLGERDATIEVDELPTIESDQLALEQIFTNLLDNAVKYLRPSVPGRIEVHGSEVPGFIVYEVKDNGRGIEDRDRGRVFELFRRSGKQDQVGEGIGLAHVRSMVRRLGGTIGLDSEFGRGTVIKLTLPRRIAAEIEAS